MIKGVMTLEKRGLNKRARVHQSSVPRQSVEGRVGSKKDEGKRRKKRREGKIRTKILKHTGEGWGST